MNCSKCPSKKVSENPSLCKEHFIDYFENKVKSTIQEYELLETKDKVCVAASGGKDSITLLYLLNKFGYNVEALAVDEGIHVYRDNTIQFLRKFCSKHKILLKVISYEEEVGRRLDSMAPQNKPACNTCGTFRRHILNKYSEGYDKIATGHNMDDESQAVLMNLLNAQIKLFSRQGPKTNNIEGFTQKIKPLYFLKEKDIMIYSYLKNFNVSFTECPFARNSFRAHVRDVLNKHEFHGPGTKEAIVMKYLNMKEIPSHLKQEINYCSECNFPCSGKTCKACRLKSEVAITN